MEYRCYRCYRRFNSIWSKSFTWLHWWLHWWLYWCLYWYLWRCLYRSKFRSQPWSCLFNPSHKWSLQQLSFKKIFNQSMIVLELDFFIKLFGFIKKLEFCNFTIFTFLLILKNNKIINF